MKNIVYFFILATAFSVSISTASATVFRINNGLTENITGRLFTEIKTAHDNINVRNGDTLMVEGSGKAYEGLTCKKRLVIIGPGYFLGDNNGVNSVVASAKISGGIYFEDGSQGSYLIGMETIGGSYTVVHTKNIYLVRCKILYLQFDGASNCKVLGSYLDKIYTSGRNNNSDVSITNCVIDNDDSGVSYVNYDNNIITGDDYRYSALKISAGTFRNNILIDRDAKVDVKSPNIQNNFAQNGQFGTDNGNKIYEPADLFTASTSSDGKYKIKASSPYIAAGYGGTQPGIFGGSEPYVLSGIPPIPIIYDLNVPGTGSVASGLNINVKIRGAN